VNPYTNILKHEAEQRVRSEIGGISGVAIQRLMAPADSKGLALTRVTIRLTGWSPSLNLFEMHWGATVDADADAGTQATSLLHQLEHRIRNQRGRLAKGMALGRAAPFGTGTMDTDAWKETEWSHLQVDRGLAILIEEHPRLASLERELSDTVFDLHQDDQGVRTGLEPFLEGESTDDDGKPFGRHMLSGREFRHDVPIAEGIFYDGSRLLMRHALPESVLLAAGGRKLGEVIDVPNVIADRLVISATQDDGETTITIHPHVESADALVREFAATPA